MDLDKQSELREQIVSTGSELRRLVNQYGFEGAVLANGKLCLVSLEQLEKMDLQNIPEQMKLFDY